MKQISANITGSIILNGVDVTETVGSSATWSGSLASRVSSLEVFTGSMNAYTASNDSNIASLNTFTSSVNTTIASLNAFTSSANSRIGTLENVTASYATTASNSFNGNQTVTGSLVVTGQVIAQTLNVQQVTSSVVYSSGSNVFGNSLANTHQFTGSLSVTGSLTSVGQLTVQQSGDTTISIRANSSANVARILFNNSTTSVWALFKDSTVSDFRLYNYSASAFAMTIGVANNNVLFNGNVTAANIIRSGGTSGQFLKADGSVDSNVYLTTGSAASTYLPLSGGTLTGALNITNANINLSNAYYLAGKLTNGTNITLIGMNGSDKVSLDPNGYGTVLGGSLSGTSLSMSGGANLATSSGDVGIGTTTPNVYGFGGSGKFLAIQNTGGYSVLNIVSNSTFGGGVAFGNAAIRRAAVEAIDGSHLVFYTNTTNSGTTLAEKGRFASDGTFLINTTTTDGTNKLIVNGGVKVTSLDVTSTVARFNSSGNWMEFNTNVLTSSENSGAHIRSVITDATVPTYSWKGDQNTGMWNPAADEIGFATGGVNRLTISSTGAASFSNTVVANTDIVVGGQAYLRYNGTYLYGRNGADNAYIPIIRINSSDQVSIDNNGVGTVFGGAATLSSTVTATSTGVDGTYADGLIIRWSGNINETNAIQTAVSTNGAQSGFRFQASNGGGSSARTTVLTLTREAATFSSSVTLNAPYAPNQALNVRGAGYFVDDNYRYAIIGMQSGAATISTDWYSGAGGSTPDIVFKTGTVTRLTITHSTGTINLTSLGTGTVYSNSGTLTNTNPSDRNLKTNITPITYGLQEVLKLNPVSYNWKDDTNTNKQFGFIAQEVQEILPDAVIEGEYLGLEKDAIYASLVNAIKELTARIQQLENK